MVLGAEAGVRSLPFGNEIAIGEEVLPWWEKWRTEKRRQNKKEDKYVMGSGDVVSLYPSLNIKISAYEVGQHFIESGGKVENLDTEAAIKFVKAGATVEEIEEAELTKLMPVRKYTRGKAPGITMKEIWNILNQKAEMLARGEKIPVSK